MSGRTLCVAVLALSSLLLQACGSEPDTDKPPAMPRFDDPDLSSGRSVWMGTCRNCHLMGVAGAPAVTDFPAWQPRIAKGRDALHHSALNGIDDPTTGEPRMPARGGNNRLGDTQVKLAVDYMVASVEHFQNPEKRP